MSRQSGICETPDVSIYAVSGPATIPDEIAMEMETMKSPSLRPLSPNTMLCVFGATLDPKMAFPEDGLCEYSFFQALEDKGPLLGGKSGGASLDAFTATAAKHSKTEYGISLDYR
ncbi:hypothetical protein V5799_005584 [Amblyomma americanum]|uniref:Uncharacterized protein n=1 Tax=Amblyomma americanum TaxID=6943 RepID=A0AAQ4DYU8_AMBAM